MMTLWWANHLKSKDDLKVGQRLVIPPVNGTVRVVKEGDTLEKIAEQAKVRVEDIVSFNGLTDTTLVIGQTLILPGAIGKPIATPKPRPVARSYSGGGARVTVPRSYGGGNFAWPVPAGSISQYYHSGHQALDIQAPYGSRVIAAAAGRSSSRAGRATAAATGSIAHGSGLYTAYYHMSAITVGVGEKISRGEQVGRIGTSGWTTGPHLHFEVWAAPSGTAATGSPAVLPLAGRTNRAGLPLAAPWSDASGRRGRSPMTVGRSLRCSLTV